MRRLLYRILLFLGFFSVFGLFFLAGVAYSTRWTVNIEEYCFPRPRLLGGTYMRSVELDEWLAHKGEVTKGLLLGGSTVYRNINPDIFSQKTGMDFFNLGSSSQTLANSSVLLKYAVSSSGDIKNVILCIDHVLWENSGLECSTDWLVNNYNPSKKYVLDMVLVAGKPLIYSTYMYKLIKSTLPGTREYIDSVIQNNEVYYHKGFVCSSDETPRIMDAAVPIPEMSRKNRKALHEIVRLCKENNIHLTFLVPRLINAEYDLSEIKRFNHNIIDASVAPVDTSLFYDNYHLYCKGTAQYTQWIADEFIRQNNLTN